MSIGGPIGAAIGGLVSVLLEAAKNTIANMPSANADIKTNSPGNTPTTMEKNQVIFFTCLFSMLGKLAKSDGIVTRREISMTQSIIKSMRLNKQMTTYAQHIFNNAKNDSYSIYQYADQYAKIAGKQMRVTIYELLWRLATADGSLDQCKEDILKRICQHLIIETYYFDLFHTEALGGKQSLSAYYSLLNCQANDTDEDIKKAYRRAIREYHPDKLESQGLPEELLRHANEKTQKINEAYQTIMKSRGKR